MKKSGILNKGFTLVEMMLVLVIVSTLLYMSVGYFQQRTLQLRLDRAAAQIQQILTAAANYYVANNATWPIALSCLQGQIPQCPVAYIQTATIINPLCLSGLCNPPYLFFPTNVPGVAPGNFVLEAPISTTGPDGAAIGNMLAGMLPLAFTIDSSNNSPCNNSSQFCYVVASIPPPGQNLNNETAVNFAGLYHSGACVPVPQCVAPMKAEIIVAPVSVTGANDQPSNEGSASCTATDTSGCQVNAYPVNSFTVSATAPAQATSDAAGGPNSCGTSSAAPTPSPCYSDYNSGTPTQIEDSNYYWRVCLSSVTEKGVVQPTDNIWGQVSGTVMVMTRCSIPGEPSGSNFTVWGN